MMTRWSEIMAGDVVRAEDGLEWFVLDRNDDGDVALLRVGGAPVTGRPQPAAEVELRYRGQLGEAVAELGVLDAVVLTHDG